MKIVRYMIVANGELLHNTYDTKEHVKNYLKQFYKLMKEGKIRQKEYKIIKVKIEESED